MSRHAVTSPARAVSREDVQIDLHPLDSFTPAPKRDRRFACVFVAICVSVFMTAIEIVRLQLTPRVRLLNRQSTFFMQTIVSVALPTIIRDLQGDNFAWIGSAYALASTALLPVGGAVSEVRWRPFAKHSHSHVCRFSVAVSGCWLRWACSLSEVLFAARQKVCLG